MAEPRPHKAGGAGVAELPPHQTMARLAAQHHKQTCRAATTPQTTDTAQRPRSKRRRGGASPAPFCCPSPQVMDFDFVAVFTRKGARHNGFLCEPAGRAAFGPAHPLCIRRRYVTHRHTTTAAGDHTANRRAGAALSQPNARAACEPQTAGDGFLSRAAQW